MTPDEERQAEGLAWEIINRVQKLRKKAGIVPTDEISIFVQIVPDNCEVSVVASKYKAFIENAIKAPFHLKIPDNLKPLIKETQQLKGASKEAQISISIVKKESDFASVDTKIPFCKFVVVHLIGIAPGCGVTSNIGTVLLENPIGCNIVTLKDLCNEIKILFCIYGRELELFYVTGEPVTEDEIKTITKTVILAYPKGIKRDSQNIDSLHVSRFADITFKDKTGALMLENPLGNNLFKSGLNEMEMASKIFSVDINTLNSTELVIKIPK